MLTNNISGNPASLSNSERQRLSLLPDSPARIDALDYHAYRDAVVTIIRELTPESALTIGVFGDWGSGKTTLLDMIGKELSKPTDVKCPTIPVVWLNAWQLSNEEQLWNAFLLALSNKVKGEMRWRNQITFKVNLLWNRIGWSKIPAELLKYGYRALVAILPMFVAPLLVRTSDPAVATAANVSGQLVSAILALWLVVQPFVNTIRKNVNLNVTALLKESPFEDRLPALDQFKGHFDDMIKALVGRKGRLVVIVDDLDRCISDRLVQVIDALKLFIESPRCVYLLGLDRDIIEQAVKSKYKDYADPAQEARDYIEKVVQLPFDLPPLTEGNMDSLIEGSSPNFPDERCAKIFALGLQPNPRKVKRNINAFLLLWQLAQRRGELSRPFSPIRLAKVAVIQQSHRDLFAHLTDFPGDLSKLESYFRSGNQDVGGNEQSEGKDTDVTNKDTVIQTHQSREALPESLAKFSARPTLAQLLKLYDPATEPETGFLDFINGKHVYLSDEEILRYITLARTVVGSDLVNEVEPNIETPVSSPTAPPNLVHPYALQANFTGRVSERQELTSWLADDAKPICALIAMGGMGKSALAWYWMQNDVLPLAQLAAAKVEGVMWWSFYEGEASFAKFIDEALKYASGQPEIDATRFPSTYDRAQELRQLLQTKRVLFILDSFERQLRAYASLNAAYRPDDDTDPSRDERACVDPLTARWLNGIAAGPTRAKLLLTTRLMARDLEDRAGDALAGVLKQELKELPRDDAVKFMQAQGVTKGTPAEIAAVCEAYGYHPLSLRLLSGLIARDARMPGDIAAAPRYDVQANIIQRQYHTLEQSYNAAPEEERTLLSRIAAFRSPMDYNALLIFNEYGDEASFDAALEDLRVRGLLLRDTMHNRYDLHPIVRRYAYDRLNDKTGVHTRLRDYFASIPVPNEDKVRNLEDLLPVIELYHHTVRAGQYDEALELFSNRLAALLYFRFGAYQLRIELLRALFPDSEERPPRLKDAGDQAWTLAALANSYSLAGQPRRAVPLFEQHNVLRENTGNKKNLTAGLVNIATLAQIILGELAFAESNLRRSIKLSRELGDEVREAVGHQELGRLLAYRGAFDEAAKELEISTRYWEQTDNKQGICLDESYRALCALLMVDARAAMEAALRAFELWKKNAEEIYPVERDLVRVEWLWGAALVMDGKDLSAADAHLSAALTRCRRINLVEFEPDILLAWARLLRARGEGPEASAYAEEALAIADRCEFRLKQAEIHNFMARLALEARQREVAREQAEIARERAWCDGPPYCYKPALEEALGMLRELGVVEEK